MKKYPIAVIGVIVALIVFVTAYLFLRDDASKNYVLKLEANSTTGFLWDYELSEDGIVQVVKDEYKEDENKEGLVGVGGTQIYEFKGLHKGEVTVSLQYKKNGTKEVGEEKTIILSVDENLNVTKKD